MPTTHTRSTTHIDRPPAAVYEFVTTPANWVGTHPVTKAVKGDTGHPAEVGGTWIEVIAPPRATPFETHWTVTRAEPGRSWTVATDQLGDPGTTCVITYLFSPSEGGTTFVRDMTLTHTDGAVVTDRQDPTPHDTYLRNVKTALEGNAVISHRQT